MASFVTGYPALIASRTAALISVMVDQIQKRPATFRSIWKTQSTDRYIIEKRSLAGFGLLRKFPTEAPADWPTADVTNRYSKTLTISWYGLRTQMTKMFIKYDIDGIAGAQQGRELVDAAVSTQEFQSTDFLMNMTSATAPYGTPDGVALAATNHPLLDNVIGGAATYSNYVNASFDLDSLPTALLMLNRQVNDRGIPIMTSGRKIIYSPNLEFIIEEAISGQERPDTAERATNVFEMNRAGLSKQDLPFSTSTTYWAVTGANHRLEWYDGQGIETDVWRDQNDKVLNADVDAMWMFGAFDWRDFVGGSL